MKRLLKKPPRKLRLLKLLLKKAPTPLLLALKPLPLVPTLLLLVQKLPLRLTLLQPLLLRLMPLLLRPLLLRLKKRSKSQPFGALTETRNGRSSFGKAAFFFAQLFRQSASGRDRLVSLPCLRRGAVVGE